MPNVEIIHQCDKLTSYLDCPFFLRYKLFIESWNTKKYIEHIFNAQRYSIHYHCICKLFFTNVQTNRQTDRYTQTDEIHVQ